MGILASDLGVLQTSEFMNMLIIDGALGNDLGVLQTSEFMNMLIIDGALGKGSWSPSDK